MATSLSYNQPLPTYDTKNNYICDCGQKYTNKTDLDQHKLNNCKSRSISCSFCQEPQPSSIALRDHLMTCGNKTDQCPNCRKFVRRAIFAYHYENNCANLEETDTPTPRPRSSSLHRPSSKSNRPSSRENDVNDHDQENNNDYHSSNHRTKTSERRSSTTSTKRYSLNTIECTFCNNQCMSSDYEAHKDSCLKNPKNSVKPRHRTSSLSKKPESGPLTNESRRSPDIVYIPCEICNEQIDLRYWSTHVQDCREREIRRIEARAETINREPLTEKFPCEHCEELISVEKLRTHEIACRKNPEYTAPIARLTNPSPLATLGLSNKPSKTDRDQTWSSTYSSLPSSSMSGYNRPSRSRDILDQINDREHSATVRDKHSLSHLNVDTKRTDDILRTRNNDGLALVVSGHEPQKQRRASVDFDSQLVNSSHDVPAYDTLALLSNNRTLSGTQSLPRQVRSATSLDRRSLGRQSENPRLMPRTAASPSIHTSRLESPSRSSADARGSHRSNTTKATNPLLVRNHVIFQSPREDDQIHQPVINQRGSTATRNNKLKSKPSFLQPPMKFK